MRTERKDGPPKVLQTKRGYAHAPPETFSNLGAQKGHFLSFPQDIFSK